uniref:Methylmalonyl CoA epimerase n=1 Tax=Cyprinus carpio carpio TaxID=630221 RepID=A0A9J7XG06_CYPCA
MASSLLKVAVTGLSRCALHSLPSVHPSVKVSLSHYRMPDPEKATHGVYTVFVELGNTKLELLHPLGEKSPIAGFLQKNKAGGFASSVDDINAAIVDLKEKKIRLLSPEPPIGAHGKPVMFLHPKDCGGVLVEIEQA